MSYKDLFPVGAVISRSMTGLLGMLYRHLGIYLGNGWVVDFDGKSGGSGFVRLRHINDFCGGMTPTIHALPEDEAHGSRIASLALELSKGNNAFDGKYDTVSNNCEAFTSHIYNSTATQRTAPTSQIGITLLGVGAAALLVWLGRGDSDAA